MKQKLLLLILALFCTMGTWAIDVVVSDQTNLNTITSSNFSSTAAHKYGTYSAPAGGTTFTTNSTSGLAGVTITSTSNIVKPFYYSGVNYRYGLAFKPTDGETYTITISAPENYVIVGYTMKAISTSQNQQFEVVAPSGTYTVSSSQNYITGRVANQQSTTFTLRNKLNDGKAAAQELCLPFFTITVLPADASSLKATNVSDISKSKTYLVHSIDYSDSDKSRGYLSATSGYLACTSKTGNWAPSSFAFVQYDGKYFLYDVTNKKFARTENYSSNTAEVKGIETNTSILPVTFEKVSDGIFKIKMGDNYMNFSGSYTYGITINYYSTSDAGNNLELIKNGSFDDTEAIATLEAYLANPTIVNGGKYKIKLNGTNFYVSKDASGNAKTEETASELIISENGTNAAGKKAYSIKDAGTNKYLSYTNITYSGGQNSRLSWADTDANSKFVFTQGSGTYSSNVLFRPADACDNNYVTSWNQNYSDQIFVFWTLSNTMSYWTLEKVTKTVTYNLKWNGSTIKTNSSVSAHIGGAAADYIPWDVPAYSDFTCDVATIGESTTEVNVTMTWDGPFDFSTDYSNAKWYYLKLNNKYVYYDTEGSNHYLLFSNDKVEEPKALWAFFGNPVEVKVANSYRGDGYFINNQTPATMETSGYVNNQIGSNAWGFYLQDSGWFIYDDGSGHVVSAQAAGYEDRSNVTLKVEPYVVTYNLKFGGSTIATKTLDKVTGDSKNLLPTEWTRDFCTYSYEPAEIGNSTTSVDVTMTWNGPFDISADYENAVWYYLSVNGKWGKNSSSGYLNAPDIFSDIADVRGADDGQWAFFGNPYDGFLLSLKEKYMSTIQVYLSSQLAAPAFGNATGSTEKWTVTRLSGSTFTLNCGDKYIVDNSTAMGFKSTALEGSEGTFSVRSYYCQQALDDLADYAEANAVDQYFGVTQESVNNVRDMLLGYPNFSSSDYSTYIPSIFTGYATIKYPATGYYRIKSAGTRAAGAGYITYGEVYPTYGYSLVVNPSGINDPSSVIHLTKVSDGIYTFSLQGLNVQATSESAKVLANGEDAAVNYTIAKVAPGYASIGSGTGRNYFHEASWTGSGYTYNPVVGWDAPASGNDASAWIIEDAESLTITMNPVSVTTGSFATICFPFDVTIESPSASGGAIVYTVSIESSRAKMNALGSQNVPAGTPVLLAGAYTTDKVTATITSGIAAYDGTNALRGTYFDKTTLAENEYVFGTSGGELGFWKLGTGYKVGANKAYLVVPAGGGVKGFALDFDDDATAIKDLKDPKDSKDFKVYNLAGQRLNKMQKGINIVNGKKVLR